MKTLQGQSAVVVGGSRGLGLGVVEALVAHGAKVTVVAHNAERLAEVELRFGVSTVAGDATDRTLARTVLQNARPAVLAVLAGATPVMAPLHEQTWAAFSAVWNTDVQSSFVWVQEAIKLPLAPGSRVLLGSSGAAIGGSPLSGGYAGAKRMIWLMAQYANGVSAELELGIRFQALVPQQIIGDTGLGRSSAEAYARRRGMTLEAFLASFGKPLPPRTLGDYVMTLLTDSKYEGGTAFGLKGDTGITVLDGGSS